LAQDITHGRAFYLDIDHAITKSEFLDTCKTASLPPPTLFFQTVKGAQAFWIFNKPVLLRKKSGSDLKDLKTLGQYEAILKNLIQLFKADSSCTNLNRKMRLPDSYRWKGQANSFFCENQMKSFDLPSFNDFESLIFGAVAPSKRKKAGTPKPVQPLKIDSTVVSMDEFNQMVNEIDFCHLVGATKLGKIRCPFPQNHKNGDANPSAMYGFKNKYRVSCHACKFSMDVRDFLKSKNGWNDSQVFQFLKKELGISEISTIDKNQFESFNVPLKLIETLAERFPSYPGINGYRLVCRILADEARTAFEKGSQSFTISTNYIWKKSGMTKMKSAGITNILCYLGIIRKTMSDEIVKDGRGISEFEFLPVTENELIQKLDNLKRLKMNNPEKFNRKWVNENLGMETATDIYITCKIDTNQKIGYQ